MRCLLPLAVAALLAGCAGDRRPHAARPTAVLTEARGGAAVDLPAGTRTVVVRLRARFSTGYRWEPAPCDRERLWPAGDTVIPDVRNGGKLGSKIGGWETQEFTYYVQPGARGPCYLKFAYGRPWEDGPPDRVARFLVRLNGEMR